MAGRGQERVCDCYVTYYAKRVYRDYWKLKGQPAGWVRESLLRGAVARQRGSLRARVRGQRELRLGTRRTY